MKRKKRRGNYRCGRPPLAERHYRAIELLAEVPRKNYDEIAAAVGIDRRTLFRWRERKDFERELQKAIDKRLSSMRKRMPKSGLLAHVRRGDTAAIEWYFNAVWSNLAETVV